LSVTSTDDERLGRLLRLIRQRVGLTQRSLAQVADVTRENVMAVEAGRLGQLPFDRTRRMFEAVGARARPAVWWNGAAADRLLDERHAALVERGVKAYTRRQWETAIEVSFADYGERGSIDILAGRESARAVAVTEVKSEIGSLEETNRVLDMKERLAPKIAEARFGWRPRVVGRILIVPGTTSTKRILERHAATMNAIYPARTNEVKAWLRAPTASIRGIWFMSEVAHSDSESL
jgi:transcriptional regulator with XRE-family HTH domain